MTHHTELKQLLTQRKETMSMFTTDHKAINMYAVVRGDLEMTPGKLAAQCGHAFHLLVEAADSQNLDAYKGTGNGTKIVSYVKNEGRLLRIYDEAKAMGIPAVLVVDRGHVIPDTMFTGEPILTAVGFGPCLRENVESITKLFTLLK